MVNTPHQAEDFGRPVRRLIVTLMVLVLLLMTLIWRIDSPRVERFRTIVTDAVVPPMAKVMTPVTALLDLAKDLRSYQQLYSQNQELRRELQQMRAWREAAIQLEQENARLMDLNNLRLDPSFTWITGIVLADSGSPFRQSVLLNVGSRDGIKDGWAAMDGVGLVGRMAGVGHQTARVILLTDPAHSLPVTIQPSGQRALMVGDNTPTPPIEFLEHREQVRAGDRVVSSGDGKLFAPGLLVGQVIEDPDGRLRIRMAADMDRLEFLRVIRHAPRPPLDGTVDLVGNASGSPRPPSDPASETVRP